MAEERTDWLPLALAAAAQLAKHSECRCANCQLARADIEQIAQRSDDNESTDRRSK